MLETASYASGYALYRRERGRRGDVIGESQRWSVIAAAAIGALAGSRILGLAEQWPTIAAAWRSGQLWQLLVSPGGKTIVGGLLGAWLAVETVKLVSGIRQRTGDLFVLPICLGIAVGRVGCLVAGLADDTYGQPTNLPWAVDLGDGVGRHPVQVYEIVFLGLLAGFFVMTREWKMAQGARFRIFLASYLGWRVAIDFLKPQPLIYGLNLIQWSCLLGMTVLGWSWAATRRHRRLETGLAPSA